MSDALGCYVQPGDLYDPSEGKRPAPRAPRLRAAAPAPPPPPDPGPFTTRINNLLLAMDLQMSRDARQMTARFGFCASAIDRVRKGGRASVYFVRCLVRLEAMYAAELEAVRAGDICTVPAHGGYVRKDYRKVKTVVGERGV